MEYEAKRLTSPKCNLKRVWCWCTVASSLSSPAMTSSGRTLNSFSRIPTCQVWQSWFLFFSSSYIWILCCAVSTLYLNTCAKVIWLVQKVIESDIELNITEACMVHPYLWFSISWYTCFSVAWKDWNGIWGQPGLLLPSRVLLNLSLLYFTLSDSVLFYGIQDYTRIRSVQNMWNDFTLYFALRMNEADLQFRPLFEPSRGNMILCDVVAAVSILNRNASSYRKAVYSHLDAACMVTEIEKKPREAKAKHVPCSPQ